MNKTINYQKISKEIRKEVLLMHFLSQKAHLGSALSCVDILTVLYFKIMKTNPKNPFSQNRDRFILSKSHAVSALYASLALKGFFPKNILQTFCQDNSKLPAHATRNSVFGIEVSTGSLGHGLPMGCGMALAGKKDSKKHKIFVLMSDGECDEGSNWEAALFASHHKLDNLIAIIDYNKLQAFGKTNEVLNLEPLKDKWKSFGWQVIEIDGHNHTQIENALKILPFKKDKPNLLIAHTKKGFGVSFLENKLESHYKSLDENLFNLAIKELK